MGREIGAGRERWREALEPRDESVYVVVRSTASDHEGAAEQAEQAAEQQREKAERKVTKLQATSYKLAVSKGTSRCTEAH